ncbi:lysozyme inhibitor LprI family protein [Azospirillum sp. sgz302134]
MRHALAALLVFLPLTATAAPNTTKGPSFDCARASQPVEKAVCADDALAAMDRLLDRAYRMALDGVPAEQAASLKGDQVRWLLERTRAFKAANEDRAALMSLYDQRLRAVIAKAGPRILPAALERAQAIDPLAEAGRDAEEEAAFVAYTLTSLHPDPPVPGAGGEAEVMSPYERYAGFTYAAPLPAPTPDDRLFVAVAVDCGAYQCSYTPFLVNKPKGTAERLAVEVVENGKRRLDLNAVPVGIPSVRGDVVEIFEQARGSGDCGVKWRYRVEGAALALVQSVEKQACDGKDWSGAVTRSYGKRD